MIIGKVIYFLTKIWNKKKLAEKRVFQIYMVGDYANETLLKSVTVTPIVLT